MSYDPKISLEKFSAGAKEFERVLRQHGEGVQLKMSPRSASVLGPWVAEWWVDTLDLPALEDSMEAHIGAPLKLSYYASGRAKTLRFKSGYVVVSLDKHPTRVDLIASW